MPQVSSVIRSVDEQFSDVEHQTMKLVSGALMLVGAEQAYAHAQLVTFPNHDAAAQVLIPASVVFLVLGICLVTWGLLTETRQPCRTGSPS